MGMKFSQGNFPELLNDKLMAETIGFFICCKILRMCRRRIDAGWM